MTPKHVRLIYDYNTWANTRTMEACAALTDEQFTRDLGSSFRSVRDTLAHLLAAGSFWLQRWQGRSSQVPGDFERFTNLASVRTWGESVDRDLHQFVERVSAADLDRILEYRTTEGELTARYFWQMLPHVVNHGSYHRGQITTMLRQLGTKALATDLIVYFREEGVEVPVAAPEIAKLRSLFEYNSWANRRTLEACSILSTQELTRDLRSSFPSVRDTLAHILLVEWLWLERWLGRSHTTYPPMEEFSDLAVVRARWAEIERDLLNFVNSRTPGDLARRVEYRNTKGVAYSNALWEMMQHLVNHGTYHRGQVATLLRQLGQTPNAEDLNVFYRAPAKHASN